MSAAAPIVKATREGAEGGITAIRQFFRSTAGTAKTSAPVQTDAMKAQTRNKLILAGGVPLVAGAGIGAGSYVGLTGVSSGIKQVASGGKEGISQLGIGLVVVVILIVVCVWAYTKTR